VRIVADENIPFVKEAFCTFGEVTLVPGRKITRSDLLDAEMLLVRSVTPVTGELLAGTSIKFVATATIGIDHVDMAYLNEHDIAFAYAPGSNADSVAEYVMAALCVLKRKYRFSMEKMTLGIIGVGNIGSRLSRHAQTLGMRPLLCDPPKKRLTGSNLFLPFNQVVAEADIITFHVPLTTDGDDRTINMVDNEFFGMIKNNAILINTSRGKVLDETSVITHRKALGGLVLDVWNNEPSIHANLLASADIATPHIAGYSFDGKVKGTEAIYLAACALYNVTPSWSSHRVLMDDAVTLSTVTADDDPLSSAILQAYPIHNDDERLRQMLTMDTMKRSGYFDELRKKYPKRIEFSHFSVSDPLCPAEVLVQLRDIGFANG
jgi:erythronate-4-phosphate dehydrogenase